MDKIMLKNFKKNNNSGANLFKLEGWYITNIIFVKNNLFPFNTMKKVILILFGAKIGRGMIIKPGVNIKYPWRLNIGDYSWLGEDVWIDNIAEVKIESNVCISQGAYICTGNHNWALKHFPLETLKIVIEEGAWIGAKAIIGPGVTVKSHSVIAIGSVVTKDTEPYTIYKGNPAVSIKKREIK